MNNHEISLFDAIRLAEASSKSLANDANELAILKTKSARTLKAIAVVKEVFGLAAKVRA
jgi:hypothetical protein